MKFRKYSLLFIVVTLLSSSQVAIAEDPTIDRATRIEQIKARWNPVFDQESALILSLAAKAKLDPAVLKSYNNLLADFTEVRRVIDAALSSTTGDIEAAASYAEEEIGEFTMTIQELAKQVAKIKTISCVKGKSVKKASGITPICPAGFKKK